jgi:Pyridine nucleotide-disulphide oxidoreductase
MLQNMLDIAIVGAGPYGLSLAAHLKQRPHSFRIFGNPMDSWLSHMPRGMMLKSDGFASDIPDPNREYTLKRFCAERNIEYADTGIPVRLDTFASYGVAFTERMVPELENRLVVSLDTARGGFLLGLDSGETLTARRVVIATGITHFAYMPPELSTLPRDFVSHSFHHHDLTSFKGRNVVVVGGGASALDLAGLLRDVDADVQLMARRSALKFHSGPAVAPIPFWKRIRHPRSGLGPGLRSCFFAEAPAAFYYLPERLRLHLVRTTLGPSGGWFIRDKVMGRVPLLLGHTLLDAQLKGGKPRLRVRTTSGSELEIVTEHIIAATGYRVDLTRLPFLSARVRSKIKSINGSPVLSNSFESAVPGLFFAGMAAANNFGPVMRFAFGAGFTARTLTRALTQPASIEMVSISARGKSTVGADHQDRTLDQPA